MLRIRYLFEYAGLVIFLAAVDHLPLACINDLACIIADCWYMLNPKRRKIARDNILACKIADTPAEASKIARKSFHHFAILIIESLKADQVLNEDDWTDRVELDIPDSTMKILKNSDQGMILISGHLGNWEVAARILSNMKPVMAITRDMNNPYTNKLMLERKSRDKLTLTPKHDANSSRFLSVLKNGGILALLSDQFARERAISIDFFGRPASTYTSPALLHMVTKTPLCFGYCIRTGSLRYRMIALDPIEHTPTGKREDDVRAIMTKINQSLESAIRQYPEQYLWAHRRWR